VVVVVVGRGGVRRIVSPRSLGPGLLLGA